MADATVAAWEEDASATRTELREQVAQGRCILQWEIFLVVTIRNTDRLRDDRLGYDVVEPHQESVARSWFVASRYHQHLAADAVEVVRCRVRYGLRILHVEVRLEGGVALVVIAAIDLLDGVGRIYRVRATFVHELLQIRWSRIFVQEARNREHIPF